MYMRCVANIITLIVFAVFGVNIFRQSSQLNTYLILYQ